MCCVVARVGFAFTRAIDRFELQVAVSSSRWSFGVPGGRLELRVTVWSSGLAWGNLGTWTSAGTKTWGSPRLEWGK